MSNLGNFKNIWVYIETQDGELRDVGLELLNPGRELADEVIIVEGEEYYTIIQMDIVMY